MGTSPTKEAIIGQFINGRNGTDDFLQLADNHGGTVFGWIDAGGILRGTLANSGVGSVNGLTGAVILSAGANLTITPSGNTLSFASVPSGATTDVQVNSGGAFYGDANFTYDHILQVVSVTGILKATSNNSGPPNRTATCLELIGSGGATTYFEVGNTGGFSIINDANAIQTAGQLTWDGVGTLSLQAGTNGAQLFMPVTDTGPGVGGVQFTLTQTGINQHLFLLNGGSTTWSWDSVLGGVVWTLASGETRTESSSTELITLSTSGTTTDSSTNLLPAGAIIHSVVARVVQTISGGSNPTTWEIGDGTTASRFTSTGSALTAGTTVIGLNQMKGSVATDAAGPTQASAAPVRITLDQIPGQGKVRVTVFYSQFTAPTS